MKRVFPAILMIVGVLITLGALGTLYWNNLDRFSTSLNLPNQLAGVQLTNTRSGDEAIAEFADLHGKQFPVTSGSIGVYGDGKITLWVAGTSSDQIASQMTTAMQGKIAEGNSPFTPLNEISDGERTVYALDGMGQKHYYFQSKKLVIWLAVAPTFAEDALQQILEVYP